MCHEFRQAKHIPPGAFSGTFNELVMCHLDVNSRNIILDNREKVWLIDWGLAGAYPLGLKKVLYHGDQLGIVFRLARIVWKGDVDKRG
jgi:hypothetical protein